MATVCERIATGELVKDVCADLEVPAVKVYEWAAEDEFRESYARARERQAHALAEQALTVADGVDPQTVAALEAVDAEEIAAQELEGKARAAAMKVVASLRANVVARDRMRMDARKWLASKIAPRDYGDRQAVEVAGPGGGAIPVAVEVTRRIVRPDPEPPT
jgi:hypothetical protein